MARRLLLIQHVFSCDPIVFLVPMTPAQLQSSSVSQARHALTSCAVPQMDQIGVSFDVVTELADLDLLRDEWIALQTAHGVGHQLFQSFDWVRTWCSHFLAPGPKSAVSLCIVTARHNGRLVMVWPLVRACRLGQCVVRWVGDPVSQYGDVLASAMDNDASRDALLDAGLDFVSVHLGEDSIVLRKVRSDSLVAGALRRRGVSTSATSEAPFISLPEHEDFEAFAKRYPAKARKNRRRHRKRLAEQGDVTFGIFHDGPVAQDLVRTAIAYKRAWLLDRGLMSVAFTDPAIEPFFTELAADRARGCQMCVFVLRCGGHPVAINVGFVSGTRILIHIAAYDSAYERFSPGTLLFESSIEACLANDIQTFDFMSPGDTYKRDWANEDVKVHDYAIGLTARGRVFDALYIRRLRPAAKYAVTRMPRLMRPISRMFNL